MFSGFNLNDIHLKWNNNVTNEINANIGVLRDMIYIRGRITHWDILEMVLHIGMDQRWYYTLGCTKGGIIHWDVLEVVLYIGMYQRWDYTLGCTRGRITHWDVLEVVLHIGMYQIQITQNK